MINKQEFYDLIKFALEEYCGRTMTGPSISKNGSVCKQFGSITAVISNVVADKNHLWVRHYEVSDENGLNIVSFFLGHAAMLFSVNTQPFRDKLLAEHTIKGVITLKQSVFRKTTIPAAVIVLNKSDEETWFTSAENIDCLISNLLFEFDDNQKVYYSKIIDTKNMMPEYYNGDLQEIESHLSNNEAKELGEIATIIAGKCAKQEDFAESGIPYLRARDIQDSRIISPDKYIGVENINKFSKQLVQEGDILLTKNFGQNKLSLVTENDIPAIVSNGLFVIRPFDVTERYLYKYLTSKTGNEVFNKQINRIQQGVTIPTIALSDLIHVLVPIYDEETMNNIESMDSLSKTEVIEATKQFAKRYRSEAELEKEVYFDLVAAGWKDKYLLKEVFVSIGDNRKWRPDLVYKFPDERKVYIEVKTDLFRVTPEWISAMKQILYGDENCFFILTTGSYYEVHASGIEKSLILLQAPTIDEILKWEKEVR